MATFNPYSTAIQHGESSRPTSDVLPLTRTQSGTKRAYRQRRKDPSCDACRDRKVKCDATDESSCSECTSRGVRCQFTKDTNKRMSSMKQIQDLQAQLSAARKQITELQRSSKSPPAEGSLQRLPPESLTMSLATSYFDSFHRWLPLVDKQDFTAKVQQYYAAPLEKSPHLGVFYAVLACGAQNSAMPYDQDGFVQQAVNIFRSYPGQSTAERITIATLLGACCLENQNISESLGWLAKATRMCHMAGIHKQSPVDPSWYCLAMLDRMAALEQRVPLLTKADDDVIHPFLCQQHMSTTPTPLIDTAIEFLQLGSISAKNMLEYDKHVNEQLSMFRSQPRDLVSARRMLMLLSSQVKLRLLFAWTGASHSVLAYCASVVEETYKLLRDVEWTTEVYIHVIVCRHLWRSLFALCLQTRYDAAYEMVRIMSRLRMSQSANLAFQNHFQTMVERLLDSTDPLEGAEVIAFAFEEPRKDDKDGSAVDWQVVGSLVHQLADAKPAQSQSATLDYGCAIKAQQTMPTAHVNRISISDLV